MAVEENETKEISLHGLELILIILLTLAGMAFWVLAGWGVSAISQSFEPHAEEFQEQTRLMELQTKLSMAQHEAVVVEEKLVEQRMEAMQQNLILTAMRETYPELRKTPPVSTEVLSVPSEVLQTYLDFQAEIEGTTQFIASLNATIPELTAALTDASATLAETRRSAPQDTTVAAAILAAAKDDLATTRHKLIEQHLELARQRVSSQSLSQAYPQLNQLFTHTAGVTVPLEIQRTYLDTQLKLKVTQNLSETLTMQSLELISRTRIISAELSQVQQTTTRQFNQAQDRFGWTKLWITLALTIVLIIALGFGILGLVGKGKFEWAVVFLGAGSLLVLLLAYQMFATMGAIIAGSLILILGVAGIARSSQTPTSAGTTTGG